MLDLQAPASGAEGEGKLLLAPQSTSRRVEHASDKGVFAPSSRDVDGVVHMISIDSIEALQLSPLYQYFRKSMKLSQGKSAPHR